MTTIVLNTNFAARLKQANLVSKIDFDNNLISFDKKNYLK